MIEIKEGPQEEMKDARKKKDPLIGSKDLRKEELKETTMVGLEIPMRARIKETKEKFRDYQHII